MKYSIAKTKHPELLQINNLWTKKFSEIHLGARNVTNCGMPMLGNNYSEHGVLEDREVCQSCLNHLRFGEPHTAAGDNKR